MKIYYIYKGCIKDTRENWLDAVGDIQFNLLVKTNKLIRLTVA